MKFKLNITSTIYSVFIILPIYYFIINQYSIIQSLADGHSGWNNWQEFTYLIYPQLNL